MKEKILLFLIGMMVGSVLIQPIRADYSDGWSRDDVRTALYYLKKIAGE